MKILEISINTAWILFMHCWNHLLFPNFFDCYCLRSNYCCLARIYFGLILSVCAIITLVKIAIHIIGLRINYCCFALFGLSLLALKLLLFGTYLFWL